MRFAFRGLAAAACLAGALAAQGMEWRLIGPFRGGRAIAVTGVPGDPNTFYFGAVGGGVWKTTDAGTVWKPVFDAQHAASIGAIEVAPSQPDTLYVGTGEADLRSDIGIGNGVYKSTDAGRTWHNIGLRDSRQIGRLLVDPRNPGRVFVAALGHAYGPNAERGVYRTTDGGRTWQHVLDKGPDIGAVDLAWDPDNTNVIYATLWRTRRPPWSQYAPLGGPGSGLYRSTDGGDTWTEIARHGLPESEWGRAGVAVARHAGGRRVYVLVDAARDGGLYRSDDGGATWTRAGADARVVSRGWYFGRVTVDPRDPATVYLPNIALYRSTDAGRTFQIVRGAPGGDDYHLLWIDPARPERMILGTDQGTTISVDGGRTWTTWYNQPTAQFYHVITDNRFPYTVYGSQQDSGTIAIASRTSHGQITEKDWGSVGGGESGYIAPDPRDANIVYASNTYGSVTRFDRRTAQGQNITPWPGESFAQEIRQRKYRAPWTPVLVFGHDALYLGTQVLLKTVDGGLNWQEISPDLTGADPAVTDSGPVTVANAKRRGYGVIYTVAPSPLDAGQIWVGSDTGLIHLTRDGGRRWADVTPPGLSDWSKITHIEASHFDAAEAWAAVDRHRLDDDRPHLFRTRDYGRTWTEITAGIGEDAFLNAVREDPARRGLLFAATETGVYWSPDDGDRWQALQYNLPVTSVRDLWVHGDDLVAATHGRSFWILDDIAPLRQERPADAALWLYRPPAAIRTASSGFLGTPLPVEMPTAKNPPTGAILDYYLAAPASGEVLLEVLDGAGQVIRQYSSNDRPPVRRAGAIAEAWLPEPPRLSGSAGLNRFVWDLRCGLPAGISGSGPQVLPGTYQVRLTVNGRSVTQPVEVRLDPRSAATSEDLRKQWDLAMQAVHALEQPRSEQARAQLLTVLSVVESADRTPPQSAYRLLEQALR